MLRPRRLMFVKGKAKGDGGGAAVVVVVLSSSSCRRRHHHHHVIPSHRRCTPSSTLKFKPSI